MNDSRKELEEELVELILELNGYTMRSKYCPYARNVKVSRPWLAPHIGISGEPSCAGSLVGGCALPSQITNKGYVQRHTAFHRATIKFLASVTRRNIFQDGRINGFQVSSMTKSSLTAESKHGRKKACWG